MGKQTQYVDLQQMHELTNKAYGGQGASKKDASKNFVVAHSRIETQKSGGDMHHSTEE